MRNFILTLIALSMLTGCGENEDGSSRSTYSSCRIISSEALLGSDRTNDLNQCWDGVDIESQAEAMQWCAGLVNSYISNRYIFGHTVSYALASNNCS